MAASKKRKKIVSQKEDPSPAQIKRVEDPSSYYRKMPTWNFRTCDSVKWAFDAKNVGNLFWTEILPFLQGLESQTWATVFMDSKKQHHSVPVENLNTPARKRLTDLRVEADSLISLRLQGTHRLYGYFVDNAFNILWFDKEHGDNDTCVCRSYKKHT